MKKKRIVIGTRGSKLALWQAEFIKSELDRLYPALEVRLNKIKTTGDKILDVPLAQVGGKGLFVKEIEEALLRGDADIAVHSMKDVPTEFPEGLHLAVVCEREDPRDAFISRIQNSRGVRSAGAKFKVPNFDALPEGSSVGTSSLRRSCQLLNIRPDLRIGQLRGNLDTRLRKLDEGSFDAVILAAAGVKRLGLQHRITEMLPFTTSLPAIGQGAIGIECRIHDDFVNELIAPLNHADTFVCVKAERAFLQRLEGGCQVPIAAHAMLSDEARLSSARKGGTLLPGRGNANARVLVMDGLVGSISGESLIKGHVEGNPELGEKMGIQLADDILSRGGREILNEVYGRCVLPVDGEIVS